MNNNIIETFSQGVELDSTFLRCISEMLNTLILRIRIGDDEMEYCFYDVLEYTQEVFNIEENCQLLENTSNQWLDEFGGFGKLYESDDYLSELNMSDCKHYIFNMKGWQFNILAFGFAKEAGFTEMYCEQQSVKDLVL
jgi:hypothetical protein